MTINLTFEPQTAAPGSTVKIHVVVTPNAAKNVRLRSGSLTIQPRVVLTEAAGGTGEATVTIPPNRSKPVTINAVEVDANNKVVSSGDIGENTIPLATAPAPPPAPAAVVQTVDPFSDAELDKLRKQFELAQAQAAAQTAQLKEREKASELLRTSSTAYSKASADIQKAMTNLAAKAGPLTSASLLNPNTCTEIKKLRKVEDEKITKFQDAIDALNKQIVGAKNDASQAQLALTEAQSAYDRVSKGLEKEITTHMKVLSDLEKEITEAEKSGDTLRVYFLALELGHELSKVKGSPDSPLDPKLVYALSEQDFKSQYSDTWQALQAAMLAQGQANDDLNSLRKQFEKAKSDLADAQSQRKQNIVKQIKVIAAS